MEPELRDPLLEGSVTGAALSEPAKKKAPLRKIAHLHIISVCPVQNLLPIDTCCGGGPLGILGTGPPAILLDERQSLTSFGVGERAPRTLCVGGPDD